MRARKIILFSLDFQMSQTKLFHYIILFVVMYLLNRKRNERVWEWSTTGRGLSTKRLRSVRPWRYSKLDWTNTWTTQSSETSFQLAYIITRDPSEPKLFWFSNWLSDIALLRSKAAENTSSSSNQLQSGNATTSAGECSFHLCWWRSWDCLHSSSRILLESINASYGIQLDPDLVPWIGKTMKSAGTEYNKTIFKNWVDK